uniref:FAM91 C-terminal domain-containing protein n=1 Tax=Arundo donax TaxID=35708 RepID=A0A0A8ZX98_ARUDO
MNQINLTQKNVSYQWVPLSLEFGIPLFSPKLCEGICERVFASHMFQKDDLSEHCDVMQNVRRRLRELCSEYQAMGPIAKLFNKRGSSRDSPHMLINSFSGRWNLNNDPSTSGGAPSEHERLKFAGRQRCRTEVVSFDGSTVRSYALAPEHNEVATKPISEEQPSLHDVKTDQEDTDSKDVVLPGVNLIFDGAELHPFDIAACLQARQPIWLIAEASAASSALL